MLEYCGEVSNLDPTNSELTNLLESFKNKEYKEAERLAIIITRKFPKHYFSWKILGALYGQTGRLLEALGAKQKAVKLNPDDHESHYNLGNTLNDLDMLEDAEASYRKAILLKPDYAEAHSSLGIALKSLGRLEEAEEIYKKAIILNPDFPNLYYDLGITLKALGRLKEAEESYRRAISIKYDFFKAHNNLGIVLKELDKIDDAEESYRQAIAFNSNYSQAHINLGGILKDRKKYEEAIKHFDLINTPYTKSQSLECLYKNGNYIKFTERLNSIALEGSINIRVAAVSAFVSHQLKKEDPYQFCKNPLDFIVVENLADYDLRWDSLIDGILKESENYQLSWESRTTKNGFQGPSDIFNKPSELISKLEFNIGELVDKYFIKFNSESNTFIKSWPEESKLTGWFNKLLKNGYQDSHIHPDGWLSGVFYLETVDLQNNDEGAIEFSLHGYDLPITDKNYPRKIYNPKRGDIVLFPSSLFHRTIPFTSDSNRSVIAFDLEPVLGVNK